MTVHGMYGPLTLTFEVTGSEVGAGIWQAQVHY
jgi:hypothetical protein